jgi:hypothetical protein
MALKALLVMPVLSNTWVKDVELPFPPFPGLGLRLDTYEIFNVDSVVVLDPRYDVTCIGVLEGGEITEKQIRRLGFEEGLYPL